MLNINAYQLAADALKCKAEAILSATRTLNQIEYFNNEVGEEGFLSTLLTQLPIINSGEDLVERTGCFMIDDAPKEYVASLTTLLGTMEEATLLYSQGSHTAIQLVGMDDPFRNDANGNDWYDMHLTFKGKERTAVLYHCMVETRDSSGYDFENGCFSGTTPEYSYASIDDVKVDVELFEVLFENVSKFMTELHQGDCRIPFAPSLEKINQAKALLESNTHLIEGDLDTTG
jgi:hypothetical protein